MNRARRGEGLGRGIGRGRGQKIGPADTEMLYGADLGDDAVRWSSSRGGGNVQDNDAWAIPQCSEAGQARTLTSTYWYVRISLPNTVENNLLYCGLIFWAKIVPLIVLAQASKSNQDMGASNFACRGDSVFHLELLLVAFREQWHRLQGYTRNLLS